jgi:hypothetical protein
MKIKCGNCGNEFNGSLGNDGLGWHGYCEECNCSFDVNIEEYLISNGTKVRLADGRIGIIDGNDEEESEEFEDINYYICLIEFTNEQYWSTHYVMLLRNEFEIVED